MDEHGVDIASPSPPAAADERLRTLLAGLPEPERAEALDALQELTTIVARREAELHELVYVASHDLTEPLRMVSSYLELLRRRYGDGLDERGHQFLFFAEDGAARMRALIDGLLAYSRLGGAETVARETDVGAVVEWVLRDLSGAIGDTGAQVTVADDLPALHVDPVQLGQVLQNLVANALKFHAPGEAARVTISARREEPGWWRITVADEGIGVPPRHADRIFRVFQRLHGTDEFPGTGIGLAICRRVAERHGGRIWVEPRDGGGSAFHVVLPEAAA